MIEKELEGPEAAGPHGGDVTHESRSGDHVHVFEESGLIVRVPDWWNAAHPPRPDDAARAWISYAPKCRISSGSSM